MPRISGVGRRKRSRAITSLLLASLDQRWKKYQQELRHCKRSYSEESTHDLRVATRRLISTLNIVEILIPDGRIGKMRRRLKRLFDAMSPMRDVQVQIMRVEANVQQFPDLSTLITILKVRERNLARGIKAKIKKTDSAQLGQTIAWLKRKLAAYSSQHRKNQIAVTTVIGSAASTYAAATYLREQVIATRPHTIHQARIGFKKLRYTLEALAPFIPGLEKKQLKGMDVYQTRMGKIQDLELFTSRVRGFLAGQPLAVRRRLSPYQRLLAAEKKSLLASYRDKADELYSFSRFITRVAGSNNRRSS